MVYDFQFPPRDEALRAELEARLAAEGAGALYEEIRAADPSTAERVDPRNGRRVVRALEVLRLGSSGHGAALPEKPTLWRETTIAAVGLDRPALVERLDRRVERMWRDGILTETERLREAGLERGKTASRAIGYAQALAQLTNDKTEAEAIAETQSLTRRYARRQVSWFRRYAEARWLDAADASAADLVGLIGRPHPCVGRNGSGRVPAASGCRRSAHSRGPAPETSGTRIPHRRRAGPRACPRSVPSRTCGRTRLPTPATPRAPFLLSRRSICMS